VQKGRHRPNSISATAETKHEDAIAGLEVIDKKNIGVPDTGLEFITDRPAE